MNVCIQIAVLTIPRTYGICLICNDIHKRSSVHTFVLEVGNWHFQSLDGSKLQQTNDKFGQSIFCMEIVLLNQEMNVDTADCGFNDTQLLWYLPQTNVCLPPTFDPSNHGSAN